MKIKKTPSTKTTWNFFLALSYLLIGLIGVQESIAQLSNNRSPVPSGPIQLSQGLISKSAVTADQKQLPVSTFLKTLAANGKLTDGDLQYVVTSEHVSSLSGIHHIYYRQAVNGIEISGTESSIHISQNGSIASANDRNLKKNLNTLVKTSSAAISPVQAIQKVANQMNYVPLTDIQELPTKEINGTKLFTKGGISGVEIPVKKMYLHIPGEGIRMIWELSIQELNTSDWWNFMIDANSGEILNKHNFTLTCNILGEHDDHSHHNHDQLINEENNLIGSQSFGPFSNNENMAVAGSYLVYELPLESPYFGTRTVVTDPEDLTASPFGWHDTNGAPGAEFTTTRGNNTITVDDINADNTGGTSPNGGAALSFNNPIQSTQVQGGVTIPAFSTTQRSLDASITNTFYWTNIIHDITYQYGFDEASGNFQENNYGNGGIAGDSVLGDVQDGSGTCNANFGTPPDGNNPRMQMFTCGTNDGSYDNLVIVHEYAHGISTRLTGGAGNSGGLLNQEQQGEGWSDYYGYMYTMDASNFNSTRAVGTFLIGQGPTGNGIRTFPYSTDMGINPQTYQSLINIGNGPSAPHPIGEIWATMLYELTQDLIDEYGFDPDLYNGTGGNNISLALVTEGLKLQPASPGFVDSRDAILLADQNIYGGANQCIIWEAFAKRGLGFSADQGDSNLRADGTAAFDVPPITLEVISNDICLANGPVTLSGGVVNGGSYSGPGVTDDGNGSSFTFDPSIAGVGVHTITYQATDCTGNLASDTDTITVTEVLPELSACTDTTITLGADGTATYNPFAPTSAVVVGGNNSGNTAGSQGFSVLAVEITEDVTITFDWAFATTDGPQFDSTGYIIDSTYFPLSDNSAASQTGNQTISLVTGQTFGFATFTQDNGFGAATSTFTNFSPGYLGQFQAFNWEEILQNSDGSGVFNGAAVSLVTSCGSNEVTLSKEVFTCLDAGSTVPVTITVTDSLGNEDTCTANVTIDGGTLNTTTFSGGTWSNSIPTATSFAIIEDNYDTTIHGDMNACSCEIETGNTVTVRDGDFLNVAGNITVDGTLIIENEGSVVQIDDNAITTNNGTIEVRKTTPLLGGRDFTVLSSPMSLETRNNVYQTANRVWKIEPSLFTPHPDVNTAINFIDVDFDYFAPTSNLELARGYLVFPQAPGASSSVVLDHIYTLGTLNSGTIDYPLEYNGPSTENNFNVVGNPFASAIDANMLLQENDAIDQLYFWEHLTPPTANNPGDNTSNHSMDDISIYNLTGGVAAANGGTIPSRYIVSGQGFGVLANQSENGTPLTFTNAMRVTGNNGTVRNNDGLTNKMWIKVSNVKNEISNTTLIGFIPEATNDIDQGYDSQRIQTTISIFSKSADKRQLSIQGRAAFENTDMVPIGFASSLDSKTEFVISIDSLEGNELVDSPVYLIDHLLNKIIDLKEEDYTFNSGKGEFPNRFAITFSSEVSIDTLEDEVDLGNELNLYPNPTNGNVTLSYFGEERIQSAIIFNVNGKLINQIDLSNFNNSEVIQLNNLSKGLYFIQIEIGNTLVTKKLLKN